MSDIVERPNLDQLQADEITRLRAELAALRIFCRKQVDNINRLTTSLAAANSTIPKLWFDKGRNSILRENKSGCGCKLGDDCETIISVCGLHEEWADKQLAASNKKKEEREIDGRPEKKEGYIAWT